MGFFPSTTCSSHNKSFGVQYTMSVYLVVMAMGFTSLQARLALRACDGNVTLAISHIVKKKEVSMSDV